MFNIGGFELLVILAVALLVLGPDKLPNFTRTVGKTLGQLRRVSTEFQRTINMEMADESKPGRTELEKTQPVTAAEHTSAPEDHMDMSFPLATEESIAESETAYGIGKNAPSTPKRTLARPKGGAVSPLRRPRKLPHAKDDEGVDQA